MEKEELKVELNETAEKEEKTAKKKCVNKKAQEEIDKAIAEVKAKGYPVNNKVLFINDCTDVVTYGHDGKTRRSFWDGETGG